MNEISIITNRGFANSKDYLPLAIALDDHLCMAYGSAFPRNFQYSNEPVLKMYTPRLPRIIRNYFVEPFCRLFKLPKYYGYISNVILLDWFFANKVANDKSTIVLATPLLTRTIRKCKERGKTIVVIAENSEPLRELKRVSGDYERYKVDKRYIYGDEKWQKRVSKGFSMGDYYITISNVSQNTFKMANFDMNKFTMISKICSNFQPQRRDFFGKKKAFITTAFHSFIKGTQELLIAWQKAQIKDVPLLIVGRLCEDMEEFVQKHGPFDNVVFVGHRSDLSTWYLDWDAVAILLSLSEGGSKVIGEMMSFGFPMIASPDATGDAVLEGINGFIIDPIEEEDKLVAQLKYLSENWNVVENMREACFMAGGSRTMEDWANEVAQFSISLLK